MNPDQYADQVLADVHAMDIPHEEALTKARIYYVSLRKRGYKSHLAKVLRLIQKLEDEPY